MVKERVDLLELWRKGGMDGNVDFLREALRVLVEGIMDTEVSARTGAEYGERSPERVTQRNGYRSRAWDTRVGTMDLHIPKLREGSYFPSLLEPGRHSERALLTVIQQAYVEGVSTRRVDDLVKAASELSPDVIVMDVMMPKKDGVEACREIMESLPETRVIMLTASTEANAVIEAVAAGATGYLQKVVGMDQVLGMMKGAASGEGASADRGGEAGLRQDSEQGEIEGGGRPDPEGEGDTCVVLPGHVIRRDCGGKGSQDGHHPKRHLPHSGKAGRCLEAGDRGVGRAERSAG